MRSNSAASEGTYFNPKGVLTLKLPPERAYEIINSVPVIYEYLPQTAAWEPVNTASNVFTNLITADIFEAAIYGVFVPVTGNGALNSTGSPQTLLNGSNQSDQSLYRNTSNQTKVAQIVPPQSIITPQDIITPQQIITPQEVITPSLTPEGSITRQVDTQVPVSSPSGTPQEQVNQSEKQPLHIPGTGLASSFLSMIKSRLSGPVLIVFGVFSLIIVVNIIIYAVYRYWWQQRVRNG